MFGVVAMETAPDHLSGAAHAVVCLFANGSTFLFDFIVEVWKLKVLGTRDFVSKYRKFEL